MADRKKQNRNPFVEDLIAKAIEAQTHSYSPYSHFKVGAALLATSGQIYLGANIESDIHRATHAEKCALDKAVFEGEREFKAIAVVGDCPGPLYPCGQCLQDLSEYDLDNRGNLVIVSANLAGKRDIRTLAELLPVRFTPIALGIDPRKY